MTIKILEDEATADVAYLIEAKTLQSLFKQSAKALFTTLADIKSVKKTKNKGFAVEGHNEEKLLSTFLEEMIFIKDRDNMVFSGINITIKKSENKFNLVAVISGDEINVNKHKLKSDVKALTMHMFSLKKTAKGYRAKLVFDL